jgi:hypothetical protein
VTDELLDGVISGQRCLDAPTDVVQRMVGNAYSLPGALRAAPGGQGTTSGSRSRPGNEGIGTAPRFALRVDAGCAARRSRVK